MIEVLIGEFFKLIVFVITEKCLAMTGYFFLLLYETSLRNLYLYKAKNVLDIPDGI